MEEFIVYITDGDGRVRSVRERGRDRAEAIRKAQARVIAANGELGYGRVSFDAVNVNTGGSAAAQLDEGAIRNAPPSPLAPAAIAESFDEDLGEAYTRTDVINSLVRGTGNQVNNFAPAVDQVANERFGGRGNLLADLLRSRTDSFTDVFSGLTNVDNDARIPGGGPLGFVREVGIGGLGDVARDNLRGYLDNPDEFDLNNAIENAIEVAGSVSGNLRRAVIQNSGQIGSAHTRFGISGLNEVESFRRALAEVAPGLLDIVGAS